MSDSRLEKFIYAICSMDVSDLPVPLSRIETLWNCLITGETPDFEPLSRNEKYLMVMLDRYDISNLPAPMSRGEKLLYKIAVGETDLSDVPGYLSRYEELLKYLIENGGISGGDFEYVLYTLNQPLSTLYTTAEKPVKSAILSGHTLVNLMSSNSLSQGYINGSTGADLHSPNRTKINEIIKFSGTLSIKCYDDVQVRQIIKYKNETFIENSAITVNGAFARVVSDSSFDGIRVVFRKADESDFAPNETKAIIVNEDITGVDIPYFEGMQSVKMPVLKTTGKNLFDVRTVKKGYTLASTNGLESENVKRYTSDFIYVKGLTDITITNPQRTQNIWGYDENKQPIIKVTENHVNGNFVISLPSNITYIRIPIATINQDDITDEIIQNNLVQVEAGRQISSYEPYKSNILTVNEPIELRGIVYVRDTLDCLTGEVTQRIGEIVLDGSEWWNEYTSQELTNTRLFYCEVPTNSNMDTSKHTMINNRFASLNPNAGGLWNTDVVGLGHGVVVNAFRLRVLKSTANTINELKEYLNSNPIVVQYELAEKFIKTVDLTTVDQDNQPTKLGTFENVTHISLESAGLIPTLEMEVATRISKELASASPLMDELSTEQQQLNTTVDEQSNNVDATMIATTEIYEETL